MQRLKMRFLSWQADSLPPSHLGLHVAYMAYMYYVMLRKDQEDKKRSHRQGENVCKRQI